MAYGRKHLVGIFLISLWGLLLGTGFWKLSVYANTPGAEAIPQEKWPIQSALRRDPNLGTLVIFAHPKCPCSRATVGELERMIPKIHGKMNVYVVFVKSKSQPEDWAKEALWRKAQAIPAVQTILDADGSEADRFGAKTSGQVFLYDKYGELVFRGGITAERGHMGDSDGRSAILSFLETGEPGFSTTPTFGCSLSNPERAPGGERR